MTHYSLQFECMHKYSSHYARASLSCKLAVAYMVYSVGYQRIKLYYRAFVKKGPWVVYLALDLDWGWADIRSTTVAI